MLSGHDCLSCRQNTYFAPLGLCPFSGVAASHVPVALCMPNSNCMTSCHAALKWERSKSATDYRGGGTSSGKTLDTHTFNSPVFFTADPPAIKTTAFSVAHDDTSGFVHHLCAAASSTSGLHASFLCTAGSRSRRRLWPRVQPRTTVGGSHPQLLNTSARLPERIAGGSSPFSWSLPEADAAPGSLSVLSSRRKEASTSPL